MEGLGGRLRSTVFPACQAFKKLRRIHNESTQSSDAKSNQCSGFLASVAIELDSLPEGITDRPEAVLAVAFLLRSCSRDHVYRPNFENSSVSICGVPRAACQNRMT